MNTYTISKPADAVAIIPRLMGFYPKPGDVCVISMGGGPAARADLPSGTDQNEWDALESALSVFNNYDQTIVVAYTGDEWAYHRLATFSFAPVATILVNGSVMHDGSGWVPFVAPTHNPDNHPIADDRDSFLNDVNPTSLDEAERGAWDAWRSGNGARAWAFIEAAKDFGPSDILDAVSMLNRHGVDPRTYDGPSPY